MVRSSVRFTNTEFISVEGVERMSARVNAIPAAVRERVQTALRQGAADIVATLRAVAPVSELDSHPGELRENIHAEDGPLISVDVMVDPPGKDGKGYAPHVEYGHVAANGTHVPAQPFFWPTLRTRRRAMRNKINTASRNAIKAAVGTGQ